MPTDERPAQGFLIESEVRLSQSQLWAAQRRYFLRQGIEAWRSGTVPHYVTNNPALARAYAEVALGVLRDQVAGGARFDAAEPFTVIELGAGSGRFAFLFLAAFRDLLALSPLAALPWRYVMTDVVPANLEFWHRHEALAPWYEAGMLDLALFDMERDDRITLMRRGVTLAPDELRHAPLVIANYVFDGIPQDAFTLRDGALMECRLSLRAERPDPDLDDPAVMSALDRSYSDHPLAAAPYPEPLFNAILADYAATLDDTTILFPAASLRGLDRLAAFAGDRLLLLTADRGEQRAEDLGSRDLGMAVHGSISLPVNYHAMAEYVVRRGGEVLTTAFRHAHLAVSAFLLGSRERDETRLAFDQAVAHFGPDDFYTLRSGLLDQLGGFGVVHHLALVRLSGSDPRMLRDCLPALWDMVDSASAAQRQELVRIIERCWQNYFHLGEARDTPFDFAMMLYRLEEYARALALFEESRRLYGDAAVTFWNMALCHTALGDIASAARCLAEARRLDDTVISAVALQMKPG